MFADYKKFELEIEVETQKRKCSRNCFSLFFTVLSADFPFLCTAVNRAQNFVHVLDFYFRSIAVYITVYIPYFILPTNGPHISGVDFYAPEYCSVFAVIQMHSAYSAWGIIDSKFFVLYCISQIGLVVRVQSPMQPA